jgi:hypothetical protein
MKKLNKKGLATVAIVGMWMSYTFGAAVIGFIGSSIVKGDYHKLGEPIENLGDPLLRSEKSGSKI